MATRSRAAVEDQAAVLGEDRKPAASPEQVSLISCGNLESAGASWNPDDSVGLPAHCLEVVVGGNHAVLDGVDAVQIDGACGKVPDHRARFQVDDDQVVVLL